MAERKEITRCTSGQSHPCSLHDHHHPLRLPSSILHHPSLTSPTLTIARPTLLTSPSGKALVYHIPQDSTSIPTPEALAAITAQISLVRSENVTLVAEAKTLRAQLATLSNTLSTADLRTAVAGLEVEKAELTERLEKLRALREADAGGEGKGIGSCVAEMQKEKVKVEADLKVWSVIEGRRSKVEKAMWDMVENARPPGMSIADFKVSL